MIRRRLWFLVAAPIAVLILAEVLEPPGPLARQSSLVVTDRNGGWMRAFASEDGGMWRLAVTREELPAHLVDAVLTFEDARFYKHPGIDPLALARAFYSNVRERRVVSGASTLTMQLARMIDPKPRTLRSKLVEMFQALQLELHYSKDQLLVAYLNLAPYGGNIEGIGAAAYFYFEKDVSRLTRDEAATLAAIPNAPSRLRPDRSSGDLLKRRNDVLSRMAARRLITEEDAKSARALPIHARRRAAPMIAPHLAQRIRQLELSERRVVSSIDPELQRRAQAILGEHAREWGRRGVKSAAVVVIENETRKVRALVGSPSFADRGNEGQVDGTNAMRSPGSTLKPFVYTMALDRGLIGTSTLLEDLPLHFKDWSPKNFDETFRGVISAEDALKISLNIPAVHLAQKLEPFGLIELLHDAGFRGFADQKRDLGLSVVLGGCEVNLLELTNLYATLASGGIHRRVSLLEADPVFEGRRFFSEGATYLISEILSDARRPELADVWRDTMSTRKMAWKTGTSYGRRDAWTVGYDARYTIGVWVGNFDGSGAPELAGAVAAAPLFFSIAQVLPAGDWFMQPDAVGSREVCALSGAIAGPFCPHKKSELALVEHAPSNACGLHAGIDVDEESGHRLCAVCRVGRNYHREAHVMWPSGVAAYFASSGLGGERVPEHDPRCKQAIGGEGPAIRLPLDGEEFLLREAVPKEQQAIALVAASGTARGRLYWFVDGELLGSSEAERPILYAPSRGAHEVVLVDTEGRRSRVKIRVR